MSMSGIGWMFLGGDPINDFLRWRRFGKTAWRGSQPCRRCGRPLRQVQFSHSQHLILAPSDAGFRLELRCRRCGFRNADAGFAFRGTEAERMLRRVLAYHNFKGAPEQSVKQAVSMIDQAGSPHRLIRNLSTSGYRVKFGQKMKDTAIALEIAINDEAERQLL
jgi:hypothetical protein